MSDVVVREIVKEWSVESPCRFPGASKPAVLKITRAGAVVDGERGFDVWNSDGYYGRRGLADLARLIERVLADTEVPL